MRKVFSAIVMLSMGNTDKLEDMKKLPLDMRTCEGVTTDLYKTRRAIIRHPHPKIMKQ